MNVINITEYSADVHTNYVKYAGVSLQPTKFSRRPIPTVVWVFYADENPNNLSEFKNVEVVEVPSGSECKVGYVKHNGSLVPLVSVMNDIFSPDELIEYVRQCRYTRLQMCDALIIRHQTQQMAGLATTLMDAEFLELLNYMQALRDFPANVDLDNIVWPPKPAFMA